MKIKVNNNTFLESLKKLNNHNRLYYRIYSILRYDIFHFIKNIWIYRKNLWNATDYDASYSLGFVETQLTRVSKYLEKYGMEENISKNKKIKKINQAIELIGNFRKDLYIKIAENQLNKKVSTNFKFVDINDDESELISMNTDQEELNNSEIFSLSQKIERTEWDRLFEILKGQDLSKYENSNEEWNSWFNGSGIKNWWD